jgi:hypothetical protein
MTASLAWFLCLWSSSANADHAWEIHACVAHLEMVLALWMWRLLTQEFG